MTDVLVAHMSCSERIEGRYIHLKIPGPQFLHVCEVEVMGYSKSNYFFWNDHLNVFWNTEKIDSGYFSLSHYQEVVASLYNNQYGNKFDNVKYGFILQCKCYKVKDGFTYYGNTIIPYFLRE